MVKNGFLHCHSTYSLYDSPVLPNELVKKAKDMGAQFVTLTDHGTMLGIEPFMQAGKEFGINTIPGVEVYLENREHIILLAKNYDGYLSISHAMRDANWVEVKMGETKKTYALIPPEVLESFRGNSNVIATSACVAGPISKILLHDVKIDRKLNHYYQKEGLSDLKSAAKEYQAAAKGYKNAGQEIKDNKTEISQLKKYTTKSFAKKIEKERANTCQMSLFEDSAESKVKSMENLRDTAIDRIAFLEKRNQELDSEKKAFQRTKNATKQKYDKFRKHMAKINELSKEKKGKDALYNEALQYARHLKSIFPNFFIELQYHGVNDEAYAMPIVAKIAKEIGVPVIAGNDAHMLDNSENSVKARQILRYNYFSKHEEISDSDWELYLKSDEELSGALLKIFDEETVNEAMDNLSVLNECHVVIPEDPHYPKIKDGESFDELLEKARQKRIEKGQWNEEYEQRLQHEMAVIKQMGYVDYHLVVRDFCNMGRIMGVIPRNMVNHAPRNFAKVVEWIKNKGYKTGVGIGPGRGSAAGSLVCNMLGITNIDPIKYGLLFERYLNPERVSMPEQSRASDVNSMTQRCHL